MSDQNDSSAPPHSRTPALPPPRTGARPKFYGIPRVQVDQLPEPKLINDLLEASKSLPHVRFRESRMAAPETSALCVADAFALGPASAFIDDHEFCHLHPPPGGSVHLTLPQPLRERIVELGWAESHPLATAGCLSEHLVTVYAPRDGAELQVVIFLVHTSYQFACGSGPLLLDLGPR